MSQAVNCNNTRIGVTSRGGGGHLTAFDGIQADRKAVDIGCEVIKKDMMGTGYLGESIGNKVIGPWNAAMKKGDLEKMEKLVSMQWISEIVFYPIVFLRTFFSLIFESEQPEEFFCTQAICVTALVHAIFWVNFFKGWDLKFDLYMTDLPTKDAVHFWRAIKWVKEGSWVSSLVRLHAPEPLLEDGQTAEEFWSKYAGKIVVIHDEHLPVRAPFLDTRYLRYQLSQDMMELPLKFVPELQKEKLRAGLAPKEHGYYVKDRVVFEIPKEDKVGYLMLGSQPNHNSVLEWVDTITTRAADNPDDHHYFFVFSGKGDKGNELLPALQSRLEELDLPENLSIVPFTYQDADTLALLMARTNWFEIVGTGGATAFELLTLFETLPRPESKVTILRSEAKTHEMSTRSLCDIIKQLLEVGIIAWEKGNARYLMNKIPNVIVANPEVIQNCFQEVVAQSQLTSQVSRPLVATIA